MLCLPLLTLPGLPRALCRAVLVPAVPVSAPVLPCTPCAPFVELELPLFDTALSTDSSTDTLFADALRGMELDQGCSGMLRGDLLDHDHA